MTAAEAGQIILEDKVWDDCEACEGNGWSPKRVLAAGDPMTTTQDGKVAAVENCYHCGGRGAFLSRDYIEACRSLGMPIPIWSKVDLANRAYFKARGLSENQIDKRIICHEDQFERLMVGRAKTLSREGLIIETNIGGKSEFIIPYDSLKLT